MGIRLAGEERYLRFPQGKAFRQNAEDRFIRLSFLRNLGAADLQHSADDVPDFVFFGSGNGFHGENDTVGMSFEGEHFGEGEQVNG